MPTDLFKNADPRIQKGRKKGSRQLFGNDFIASIHEHFLEYGDQVIMKVIKNNPEGFLKICAKILPHHLKIETNNVASSPAELTVVVDAVRDLIAVRARLNGDAGGDASGREAEILQALPEADRISYGWEDGEGTAVYGSEPDGQDVGGRI